MHASNRVRIQNNDGEHFITDSFGKTEKLYTYAIVAEPSDFKEALEIAGNTIKQTLNKINKSSMEIYDIFIKFWRQKVDENSISGQNTTLDDSDVADVGITIKELSKLVNLSDNRTREYINQLLRAGFISRQNNNKREFEYYPTSKKFETINIGKLEFSKEELEQWVETQIGDNSERLEVIYPSNRAVVA